MVEYFDQPALEGFRLAGAKRWSTLGTQSNWLLVAVRVPPPDGYERYIKPFAVVEGVHVSAAMPTCLLADAVRHAWPADLRPALIRPSTQCLSRTRRGAPLDLRAVHQPALIGGKRIASMHGGSVIPEHQITH